MWLVISTILLALCAIYFFIMWRYTLKSQIRMMDLLIIALLDDEIRLSVTKGIYTVVKETYDEQKLHRTVSVVNHSLIDVADKLDKNAVIARHIYNFTKIAKAES